MMELLIIGFSACFIQLQTQHTWSAWRTISVRIWQQPVTSQNLILISDHDSWSWITTADNPHTLTPWLNWLVMNSGMGSIPSCFESWTNFWTNVVLVVKGVDIEEVMLFIFNLPVLSVTGLSACSVCESLVPRFNVTTKKISNFWIY